MLGQEVTAFSGGPAGGVCRCVGASGRHNQKTLKNTERVFWQRRSTACGKKYFRWALGGVGTSAAERLTQQVALCPGFCPGTLQTERL